MAYNNNPFWDFVRNLDSQQGPEHTARQPPQPQESRAAQESFQGTGAFPFAGPGFDAFVPFIFGPPQHPHHGGPGRGRRGRGCHRGECPAMNPEAPRSPSHGPEQGEGEPQGPHFGRHPYGRHGYGRRGGRWGRGDQGPSPFTGFGNPSAGVPFDMSALINSLASHPIAAALKTYVEEASRAAPEGNADPNTAPAESAETLVNKANEETDTFAPALDIFSTPTSYVLHIALPGAKKEDVGVNWDSEKSELSIAGVVYRAGDEEFLKGLKKSERRVGMFERNIKLPVDGEEKEEIDSDTIAAKLEDGVLVITVGKIEKEEKWTDLKRVTIE